LFAAFFFLQFYSMKLSLLHSYQGIVKAITTKVREGKNTGLGFSGPEKTAEMIEADRILRASRNRMGSNLEDKEEEEQSEEPAVLIRPAAWKREVAQVGNSF
jgi:hypothetical protein